MTLYLLCSFLALVLFARIAVNQQRNALSANNPAAAWKLWELCLASLLVFIGGPFFLATATYVKLTRK